MRPRPQLRRWQKVARNCPFCRQKTEPDYKRAEALVGLISERGKILAAARTGLCPKHQRRLAREIKRARFLGLLPFGVRPDWPWQPAGAGQ